MYIKSASPTGETLLYFWSEIFQLSTLYV